MFFSSLAGIVLSPPLLQIVCSVLVVFRLDLQWSLAAVDSSSPSRVRPSLDHITSMQTYMYLCGLGCTAQCAVKVESLAPLLSKSTDERKGYGNTRSLCDLV